MDVSLDGGRIFTHVLAPAAVAVDVAGRVAADGSGFYDTEMVASTSPAVASPAAS